MKRFERRQPPADFDETVGAPGATWLAEHASARPPPYWSRVRAAIDAAFDGLCAYSVIHLHGSGTVDHFVSIDEDRSRAYDWSNFRYSAGWVNSCKRNLPSEALLDPFEVEDDWFEIHLPSLQLQTTDACPPEVRPKAEFTIARLRLRDGERAIRGRQALMELYAAGKLPLETMDALCPLLARALRKRG